MWASEQRTIGQSLWQNKRSLTRASEQQTIGSLYGKTNDLSRERASKRTWKSSLYDNERLFTQASEQQSIGSLYGKTNNLSREPASKQTWKRILCDNERLFTRASEQQSIGQSLWQNEHVVGSTFGPSSKMLSEDQTWAPKLLQNWTIIMHKNTSVN